MKITVQCFFFVHSVSAAKFMFHFCFLVQRGVRCLYSNSNVYGGWSEGDSLKMDEDVLFSV